MKNNPFKRSTIKKIKSNVENEKLKQNNKTPQNPVVNVTSLVDQVEDRMFKDKVGGLTNSKCFKIELYL